MLILRLTKKYKYGVVIITSIMIKILELLNSWLHKPNSDIILSRIIEHKLLISNKYNSSEFKSLPHIQQIDVIISDSIIPDLYKSLNK